MAYTPVPTVNTGDLWTAANHNTYIKDNFAAGVPDIFTAVGDLAVGSGSNAADRLAKGNDYDLLIVDSGESLDMKWVKPRLFIDAQRFHGYSNTAKSDQGPTDRKVLTWTMDDAVNSRLGCFTKFYFDPTDVWEMYMWFVVPGTTSGNARLYAGCAGISPGTETDWNASESMTATTRVISTISGFIHRDYIGQFTAPTAGDALRVQAGRIGTDGADTYENTLYFLGLELHL